MGITFGERVRVYTSLAWIPGVYREMRSDKPACKIYCFVPFVVIKVMATGVPLPSQAA